MKFQIIPSTLLKQNTSLIWCTQTNSAALIDPGEKNTKICQLIEQLDLNITTILITHGHLDHVGGALYFSIKYNIPILGPHFYDHFLLKNLSLQGQILGYRDNIKPFIPKKWLYDGDIIKIGKLKFTVLHCPGHTPGHIIFLNENFNYIFMGDVLFKGTIGSTIFPGGDLKILINSIRYKLMNLNPNIVFIPGHGPMSTLQHEWENNVFIKTIKF